MQVAGILLTGGASTRMGADKALIRVGGRRLVDIAAERVTAVTSRAVEVGPGHSDLPVALEDPPGGGPLAAFIAGAEALRAGQAAGPALLLAVDMPLVTEALLRLLTAHASDTAAVIPVAGSRVQPLCAVYPPAAVDTARELMARGHRSMRALLDAIPLSRLDERDWQGVAPRDAFTDVDTPEALLAVHHVHARTGA